MCPASAPRRLPGRSAGHGTGSHVPDTGKNRRRRGGAWGLFLLAVGVLASLSPAMTMWWALPAIVAGAAGFAVRGDRRGLLLTGNTLWLLALTGLPIAGRPAPLLSTMLAFAGTRAYRAWSAQRRAAPAETAPGEITAGETAPDETATGHQGPPPAAGPPPPAAGPRPVRRPVGAGLLLGLLTWAGGLVGAVALSGTWMGRFQIFPGLDVALTASQIGSAAGLTAVIDSPRSRLAVLVPLGLSIVSLSMLFWLFFLAP